MEDFDLWFRLAKMGTKIEYQKKVLLKYQVRQMSLSGNAVQRAERVVTAMKLLEKKYVLTGAEKERLNNKLKLSVAHLQIETGKYNLVQENFALARENFCKANKYYQNLSIRR